MARHGVYERRTPAGTLIARWYCRESHQTFSLLPDCLAARLPGTLRRLEKVVAHAEQGPSLMNAADEIRRDGRATGRRDALGAPPRAPGAARARVVADCRRAPRR